MLTLSRRQGKFEEAKGLHEKLMEDLHAVGKNIDQLNERRPRPFTGFDPRTFECSVSI